MQGSKWPSLLPTLSKGRALWSQCGKRPVACGRHGQRLMVCAGWCLRQEEPPQATKKHRLLRRGGWPQRFCHHGLPSSLPPRPMNSSPGMAVCSEDEPMTASPGTWQPMGNSPGWRESEPMTAPQGIHQQPMSNSPGRTQGVPMTAAPGTDHQPMNSSPG